MKRFILILAVMVLMTSTAFAARKTIIYVPIDNRPVNLFQAVQVAEKLDYEVLTPPEEFFGTNTRRGNPDKLWEWLYTNAPKADFAVISTDAMIYGSLVDSRIHDLSAEKILERAQRFKTFHEKFSWLPIYAFGTIMRTPRSGNNTSTEPDYYKIYGATIFNYTALLDKQEMNQLKGKDKRAIKKLEAEIPKEYLDDWFKRRAKNSNANELFIEYTRVGVFDYFLLGCDDSAIFSQTHRESRHLTELASDMGKTFIQVTSGADELAMLMISRAINHDMGRTPFVSVVYNDGVGANTFPIYCNEPIGISVDAAIIAAGGLRVPAHERADLVIAVNTRKNGKTFEAPDVKKNKIRQRGDLKTFMAMIKELTAKNYPVGVADIAFANGADNALMNQLKLNDLQFKIKAYGGWNTATNSSGFLIGAGVLTQFMNDKDVAELLITRYLDDWAYEANIRLEIQSKVWAVGGNVWAIDAEKVPQLEQFLTERMNTFAAENLIVPRRWKLADIKANLPWQRTFECDPRFKLSD